MNKIQSIRKNMKPLIIYFLIVSALSNKLYKRIRTINENEDRKKTKYI